MPAKNKITANDKKIILLSVMSFKMNISINKDPIVKIKKIPARNKNTFKGLKYITKWKAYPIKELKKTQIAFKKKGMLFVIVGKLLPVVKIFVPIVAGVGKMNRILYNVIIIITSFIWASIFVSLGFFFGKSAELLFKAYLPILILVALIVIWFFYKYMNSEEVLKEMKR